MIILELILFVALGLFRHYAQTTLVRKYLNDPILAVRQAVTENYISVR